MDEVTREELVFNETSKLAANLMNTLAASCFTVGVLTPLVTILVYLKTEIEPEGIFLVTAVLFVSSALGAFLHRIGQRFLRELVP